MTFLTNLSTAISKRRQYNRTVAALKSMSIDTALDLDLYQGDACRIASQVVYGR
ncbi:MAG: hypothetical protein AAF386_13090 [Pseudomonadota bacterium]